MKNQSVRDLLFNPLLHSEFPYRYTKENKDGTVTITFSKNPKIEPSIVETAELSKKLDKIKINMASFELFFENEIKELRGKE